MVISRKRFHRLIGYGLGTALCVLVLCTLVVMPTAQAQDDERRVLNLSFALDTSGSMYSASTFSSQTDLGVYRPVRADASSGFSIGSMGSNDPEGLRFAVLDVIFQWLADLAARQDFNINVSVVTFDDATEVLLPWTSLVGSTSAADPASRVTVPPPPAPSERANSNFVELTRQLADQATLAPEGGRTVTIVVTDSIHCVPEVVPNCELTSALERDLRANAVSIGEDARHVLFLTGEGIPTAQYWSIIQRRDTDLLDALTEAIAAPVFFETIDALPNLLMETVLTELATTLGLTDPGSPLTEDALAQIGVFGSGMGQVTVPPYQSSMSLLAFLPASGSSLALRNAAGTAVDTDPLYSGEDAFQFVEVTRPDPGLLTATATGITQLPVYVSYTPAQTALRLVDENGETSTGSQYGTHRLRYEIRDAARSLFVQENAVPVFDFALSPRDSTAEPITITGMRPVETDDGAYFESAPFVLTAAGTYTFEALSVLPGEGGLWNDQGGALNFGFLIPTAPRIDAGRMVFNTQFGRDEDRASVVNGGRIDDGVMVLPRSLTLPITVTAIVNGAEAALPPGIEAVLMFLPPAETGDLQNACPTADPVTLEATRGEDAAPDAPVTALATALRFRDLPLTDTGACSLRVGLAFTSDLPPLEGDSITVYESDVQEIEVTITERLSLVLLDADGQPLTEARIQDVGSLPDLTNGLPVWPAESVRLIAELRDENGDPVDPIFAAQSSPGLDRSHCPDQQAVLAAVAALEAAEMTPDPAATAEATASATAEATAEAAATTSRLPAPAIPQTMPGTTGEIIPVTLSITTGTGTTDEALTRGTCFVKAGRTGRYVAVVSGLPAGTYQISAALAAADAPLNVEVQEYLDTAPVTATLIVERNTAPLIQVGAPSAFVVLLMMAAVVRFNQRRAVTMHPLTGTFDVYAVPPRTAPDAVLQPVWTRPVPRRNAHTFSGLAPVEIAGLPVSTIAVTTKKDKAVADRAAAYVTVTGDGGRGVQPINDVLIESDGVLRLGTSTSNVQFFLVKNATGGMTPDRLRGEA